VSSPESVCRLHEVTKAYGATTALHGVSLELGAGEVLALLGPNGAGKTTALSLLVGLRRPDSGTARLFGEDPRRPSARRHVGVTPQELDFPGTLRVVELLDLVRAHYPQPAGTLDLLRRFGLEAIARRQAGGLSGGERRRLAVALAFAGRPRALFLDEPTAGLDVAARRRVWEEVRAFAASGGAVLLTTHDLAEAEQLASCVCVIHRGRILVDGTLAEVRAVAGLTRIRIRAGALPSVPGIARHERHDGQHTLFARHADEVIRALVLGGVTLDGLEVLPAGLEEAFVAMTGDEG